VILTRPILALGLVAFLTAPLWAQEEQPDEAPSVPAAVTANASLVITLESTTDIERRVVTYLCDDEQALTVQYVNAAPNFLAILPVDGENHIFAAALSASGARYVSGPFEWWSTGGEANLRDLTQGEDADPLLTCSEVGNTP
jgi:membrane-bound inhibitor of C-type lysozyme